MITYVPEIYSDELLYSQLARCYVKAGYGAYTYMAEEFFQDKKVRPDIEFINTFTPAALQIVTRQTSMKEIIMKHTMFPYYGQFISKERRNKAFQALVKMQGNYNNLLPKVKSCQDRFLRYCPVCVSEDRNKFGETYWHRKHQIIGIHVCPVHRCYLKNSKVAISVKASPLLHHAEEAIPQTNKAEMVQNDIEYEVAEYVTAVFETDFDMDSNIGIGDFLHSRMIGTKYLSVRGKKRYMVLLHKDFNNYYKDLPKNRITELWQLQKIVTNDRSNFVDVCLLAYFLNIPVTDLVNMKMPEVPQDKIFDAEIKRLHDKGMKYTEIAKAMGMSYDFVKTIGNGRYGISQQKKENPQKGGVRAKNWEQLDEEYLPLVKKAILRVENDKSSIPKKVTVFRIEREIGLPKGSMKKMPKCREEINKHSISQEQLWAKKVVWAVQRILSEGQPLNWKHIRDLTNMRKENFQACKPYLEKYTDVELAERIKELL